MEFLSLFHAVANELIKKGVQMFLFLSIDLEQEPLLRTYAKFPDVHIMPSVSTHSILTEHCRIEITHKDASESRSPR